MVEKVLLIYYLPFSFSSPSLCSEGGTLFHFPEATDKTMQEHQRKK